MNACPRCAGNILESYDEHLREWYLYCMQCGNRPAVQRIEADGPPKCLNGCGRPRSWQYSQRLKVPVLLTKCVECRQRQSIRKRKLQRISEE